MGIEHDIAVLYARVTGAPEWAKRKTEDFVQTQIVSPYDTGSRYLAAKDAAYGSAAPIKLWLPEWIENRKNVRSTLRRINEIAHQDALEDTPWWDPKRRTYILSYRAADIESSFGHYARYAGIYYQQLRFYRSPLSFATRIVRLIDDMIS